METVENSVTLINPTKYITTVKSRSVDGFYQIYGLTIDFKDMFNPIVEKILLGDDRCENTNATSVYRYSCDVGEYCKVSLYQIINT